MYLNYKIINLNLREIRQLPMQEKLTRSREFSVSTFLRKTYDILEVIYKCFEQGLIRLLK